MHAMTTRTPASRQIALRARRAFSLLELTLVIAIIGVLMAVAAVNLFGSQDRANKDATVISMENVDNALTEYKLRKSVYPPSLQILVDEEYLQSMPQDAWGQAFYYSATDEGRGYKLISLGKDGLSNTEDDIHADLELAK